MISVNNLSRDKISGITSKLLKSFSKLWLENIVKLKLLDKFDAVKFVKLSSEIIGGQGGGGRKDFAQAGGVDQSKIEQAFDSVEKKLS